MLLMAIREGTASEGAVAEARELLLGDVRVPADLKEEALTSPSEREVDAAVLLSVLGLDDDLSGILRGAIAHEAGEMEAVFASAPWEESERRPLAESVEASSGSVDVAENVLGRVDREGSDWVYGPTLSAAVKVEAGQSPVSVARVLADCGLPEGLPVVDAIRDGAGNVDVSVDVVEALSLQSAIPVAAAIRFECGQVDVRDAVMHELSQLQPSAVDLATVPAAANRSWGAWVSAAVAAAVLLAVAPNMMGWNAGSSDVRVDPMRFAMAAEVIVEDLSYSDTVQVMQTEGDEGALIIWLDEEAVL
jgi:hypothetical protein